MNITLQQSELESAIREHIANMGIKLPVNDITFTATRGATGITADVEVGALPQTSANDGPTPRLATVDTSSASAPKAENAPATPETSEASNDSSDAEAGDSGTGEGKSLFG